MINIALGFIRGWISDFLKFFAPTTRHRVIRRGGIPFLSRKERRLPTHLRSSIKKL